MLLDEGMNKRILVIEDDSQTLEIITHFLKKHKNVETIGSLLLEKGKKLIKEFKPHLVISDINLPDGLGHDLLAEVNKLEKTLPIIFISGYYQIYESSIPQSPHIAFLKKPISLQVLWDHIKEMLYQDDGSFPFRLSDYLQLTSQGRHSVLIEWKGQGTIMVKDGELWTAVDAHGHGEEALKRMVVRSEIYRDGGEMVCRRLVPREVRERTIFTSAEHLLLNAVSEEEELLATIPGNKAEFSEKLREDARFEILLDEGTSALLEKNYPKALWKFLEANKINDNNKTIQANISRLREMNVEPEEEK